MPEIPDDNSEGIDPITQLAAAGVELVTSSNLKDAPRTEVGPAADTTSLRAVHAGARARLRFVDLGAKSNAKIGAGDPKTDANAAVGTGDPKLTPDAPQIHTNIDDPLPPKIAIVAGGRCGELVGADGTFYAWTDEAGRDENEDGFLIDDESGQYAVADGMGGGGSGERASKIALRTFAINRDKKVTLHEIAKGASRVLRKKINDSKDDPNPISSKAGTTLVTARILEKSQTGDAKVELGVVGDSKGIALDPSNKRKLWETVGQSAIANDVVQDPEKVKDYFELNLRSRVTGPVTPEIIDEVYLACHPEGRRISNSIGGKVFAVIAGREVKPPEMNVVDCPEGSVLLLLSDGATNVVSTHEIEKIFYENEFQEACQILVRLIMSRQNALRTQKDLGLKTPEPTMVLREWPNGQKTILKIGKVHPDGKITYPTDNCTVVGKRV